MKISLTNAGKRFNHEWIFRKVDYTFLEGSSYAITGPNGSGKSTLLQAIGGALALSEGEATYSIDAPARKVEPDFAFRHISIAAPYLELIEEMTVTEFLHFHQQFKPLLSSITIPQIIETVGLSKAADKQIRFYSSGMKQRVKLAQAIFSHVDCILLDEPCTNLDAEGIALYQRLIAEYGKGRTFIVSSNDTQEYSFCEHRLSILDYKK
ncbi:ABC transporter ATP-binding protein [Pseudoflavitalea sp. G-6-1-2]|uniref:ABC transporter ATP-binding protein n=1 Tax=Pseudoflavitalea sp. G-6-1-2 TaxID=2728841 RepID=UPI00146C34B5|nr:ATP-binding cassette domain-containing protein [Pseudoflavitalea sp. G-6-1-2]NML20547.1 ABC transporter ATP-binding protein [Pseudoflavitalea sp. G-6-1-2]